MKKFLFSVLIMVSLVSNAQLKSPDEFLGYALGSKYTPHYKIVNYFLHAVGSSPKMASINMYGETNEGRQLIYAVVASAENFSHLEDIQKNNLRLTGMLKDKPANLNAPAIVWLSYNVHGNETSSSEVAMKVLYELLNPNNLQTKEYLKNVVVIIDPCLNPDGRDRYVNWQKQVIGKNVNPVADAREHHEPWPGGRTNHYNFDLNRDWAWQTQVESQQRIKEYNRWMPQIHSDYHEQMPNNPYYFAPAAEPYHESITNFQRDFQVEIGRNNAKYFDNNGWLYFTKEIFDLFYPSYGDTYPLFNGSVGMTFEQAGHGVSSTAIITNTGDTLTLNDRIAHHYTTSMSTLEVVSKNSNKVVKEFKKFFDDANTNGVGEYKSFIVTDANSGRLNALKNLLDKNNIQYSYNSGLTLKGFNYFTQKEETFTTKNSLVVNTHQPKGVLAKVLFEPKSKLVDSATYDITAWALPYVFGVQSYAVREKIVGIEQISTYVNTTVSANAYGYAIKYNSFNDAKLLASLLDAGIKVRYATRDFTVNNQKFAKGTLLVLKKSNEDKLDMLQQNINKFQSSASVIQTGFMDSGFDLGSDKVVFIKKPSVAMVTGNDAYPESAGEVWHLFDHQLNYPITLINADDLSTTSLKNIDVLIVTAGRYKFLSDKDGNSDLKNWVRQGGKIIALDNAVSQMASGEWGIKLKKSDDEKKDEKPGYDNLKKFGEREHDGLTNFIPGAIYKTELDATHPLAFGLGENYFTLKQDDNTYEFLKDGWNVGVIKKDNYVAGFVGFKLKSKLQDAVLIAEQPMGNGDIIYIPDNPIFRNFWENGKLLLSNAVFFAGQ